jgi:hypothetical protein
MRQLCDENDMLLSSTRRRTDWEDVAYQPSASARHDLLRQEDGTAPARLFDIDDNVFAVSSRINSTWGGN